MPLREFLGKWSMRSRGARITAEATGAPGLGCRPFEQGNRRLAASTGLGGSVGPPSRHLALRCCWPRDPEDEDPERGSQRVRHVKCNYRHRGRESARDQRLVAVEGSDTARFLVTGTSGVSAVDLLAAPIGEQRTKRDDAADFIRKN